MRVLLLLFVTTGLLLSGCSSNDEQAEGGQTEQELYEAAGRKMEGGSYELAIKHFQMLEARYPFGPYAEQAQLELIYAYYKSYNMEAAIEAADRFIRLHPQHPNVDYAYYLRGLANYDQDKGLFDRFLPTESALRDPGPARNSFNDFAQMVSRYPDSQYAPDARARMQHLKNTLARYEIYVANYYLRRTAFVAAANRGRYVVEHFPQTPAVADALAIMVQSYLLMGEQQLADDALAVLRTNYPSHPNLNDDGSFIAYYSGKGAKPSWLAYLTAGLFGLDSPREINNPVDLTPPRS